MNGQHSNCPGKALGIENGIADSRHTNEMTKRSLQSIKLRCSGQFCKGHLHIGSNQ